MAVDRDRRFDDVLRTGSGPLWRVLAAPVQRSKVVGRRCRLGIGMQEGRAGHCRPNASTHVGVSEIRHIHTHIYIMFRFIRIRR